MTVQEAIKCLEPIVNHEAYESKFQDACKMAMEALEKQIPKKPVIKPWSAATCPICGVELSEDLGDGYYKHYTHWEYCRNPECLQKLDWSK